MRINCPIFKILTGQLVSDSIFGIFWVLWCLLVRGRRLGTLVVILPFIRYFLHAVIQVGVPILEQQLSNIDIPDISGSASVDVIGTIDYELKK